MPDFLLEIGCEEIPARMIGPARKELAERVGDLLTRERLASSPEVETYATPRRLAVIARSVAGVQPDVEEQVLGPSVKVAYKNDQPTPAAEAFARKVGVDLSALQRVTNPKGEYLAATVTKKGRPASEILSSGLPREIGGIYWAKTMHWRGKNAGHFVRPVRWLVVLLDGEPVPLEFGGVTAWKESRGHRQLGAGNVDIAEPSSYKRSLAVAGVIADPAERLATIRKALDAATRTVSGARWREDAELLDTVVNLTEFPSVILGGFEREFLSLPEEALVTVMRDHQKYFAVEDANGKLAPYFLAVLNTDGDPEGLIRHGNERVLRARFNDARFFWNTDQKHPLKERLEMLKAVTFQKDLGSYYEKAIRVTALADHLATGLEKAKFSLDHNAIRQAAKLAKTDLTTELVKEFTELQGIVGGLYAQAQGLDATTAYAIYDQYRPESMEDQPPRSIEGAVLSISDKADSIAGMFALGLQPTGSKDPFALRRQANGIVKTLAEHRLGISLNHFFAVALNGYKGSEAEKKFSKDTDYSSTIAAFFRERLEFYLRDTLGYDYDVVNAVLAIGGDDVVDAVLRAEALKRVRNSEDFASISVQFKRIKNILRQARESGKAVSETMERILLVEPSERSLADKLVTVGNKVEALRLRREYTAALWEIAKLRPLVDGFFDKVMVMVEDERLRGNRLALLQSFVNEFSTIADFSEIVTESKTSM